MKWLERQIRVKKHIKSIMSTGGWHTIQGYWSSHKDSTEIGLLYEQYIGYLYEDAGYEVEYKGIDKGNLDGGIDLICRYKSKVLIIQCKYRSDKSFISIKDIYQLFGAVCHYSATHTEEDVDGLLYTTGCIAYDAKQAANLLSIGFMENYQLADTFPIVKCKADIHGYYLPSDWDYKSVKLDLRKGDCYCRDEDEARSKGFSPVYA